MSKNKEGIAKNFEVVREELSDWKMIMPLYIQRVRDAEGVGEKVHKTWNLVTESIRLLPRTLGYASLLLIPATAGVIGYLGYLVINCP